MTSGSYNPNHTDELNPEYFMCGGRWHATNVSKFFSCYYFIMCLVISALNFCWFGADKWEISLMCTCYTIYCLVTIYGVFLEKRLFLIPFLIFQGISCLALLTVTVVFAVGGIFTNMIQDHHRDTKPLRDLYEMQGLNPDKEAVQTIMGTLVLLFLLLSVIFNCLGLCSMWSTYKCYKEQDRIRNPKYHRGIIADSEEV